MGQRDAGMKACDLHEVHPVSSLGTILSPLTLLSKALESTGHTDVTQVVSGTDRYKQHRILGPSH